MLIPPIRDPTQERDNVFLDFLNFSFSKKVGAGGFGTPCGVTRAYTMVFKKIAGQWKVIYQQDSGIAVTQKAAKK
jgi:hypothetical protein